MKLATRIFRKDRGTGADQYYITSPFGWRYDPISGEYKGHNGCDYGTHGNKWAQYALEDGVVESTYKDYYGALCVRVKYPRLGYRCTHAHLDSIKVSKGQSVNKDTILGYTGTTGYSTGVHLHLGVQYIGDDKWIDPESLDYQEGPTPTPTPGDYPWNGTVKAGSPLYNEDGVAYQNGASADRAVIVQGEQASTGRYQVYGETFTPHVVYVDKGNVTGGPTPPSPTPTPTDFPWDGVVKKGTVFYRENGTRYPNPAARDRNVTVQDEKGDMYKIWCKDLNPNTVYVYKSDVIRNSKPTTINVGDTVEIIATGNASSFGDKKTAYGIGLTGKVARIFYGRPYPYQVNDNEGAIGFYQASALKRK